MAENKEGQEKTEQATAKRLQEARLRGQVAKSMDVTTAAVILIGGIVVFILGHNLFDEVQHFAKYIFKNLGNIEINFDSIQIYYADILGLLAKILLPSLIIIFIIVLTSEISQVGLKIATKKFKDGQQFKQIFNPFAGLKKIFFSGRSFFELIKSLMKIVILGSVVYSVLHDESENIIALIEKPFMEIGKYMTSLSLELIYKVGSVYIAIALADYFYQKYKFKKDMMMTKHEVKEEMKQSEGDPKVKGRLRALMRQRIRGLMMKNVPSADVVITNPTHYAVALRYKQGMDAAPIVVAKGVDFLALQIREVASQHDIPIVEEPPLARAIYFNVEIDQEIPENLFKAVAQILAYVFKLRKRA